jgi:hypothetical protein
MIWPILLELFELTGDNPTVYQYDRFVATDASNTTTVDNPAVTMQRYRLHKPPKMSKLFIQTFHIPMIDSR